MRYRDDDDDDEEDDVPRRRRKDSRTYYHSRCRKLTVVSGGDYAKLCDPYWFWSGAFCCHCDMVVPLNTVEWDDTGEPIRKYRRRMRRQTPGFLAAWQLGLGALVGAVVGFGIAVVSFLPIEWSNKETTLSGAAAVVGAVVFHFAGAAILKSVYRIDYRRME